MCCGPEADVQYAGGGPTIRIIWPGICLVFPNVRDKLQLFGSPRVLHSTCFFLLHLSGPALSLPPINFLVQSTSTSHLIQTWQGNPMLENYTVLLAETRKSPPERECNCRGTTRSTFMRCCIPAHNPSIVGPMNGMRGDKLTR